MGESGASLLWTLAESDEVQVETRKDGRSAVHRTTIWIVATRDGVYVRSVRGTRGRWYQEALANPLLSIHVGPRSVKARAVPEKSEQVIRDVSEALRQKYGERWSEETDSMLKPSVLHTTLRLEPL
jgi:hypothetical protein